MIFDTLTQLHFRLFLRIALSSTMHLSRNCNCWLRIIKLTRLVYFLVLGSSRCTICESLDINSVTLDISKILFICPGLSILASSSRK